MNLSSLVGLTGAVRRRAYMKLKLAFNEERRAKRRTLSPHAGRIAEMKVNWLSRTRNERRGLSR